MSFGRSKFTSPKSIARTGGNQQQTPNNEPQSSLLYDRYGRRLAGIEQNLNAICSQHDALMPLLTLLDTMPQLSKSEQQIRAASKKISEFESRLDRLQEVYLQSRGKEVLDGAEDSFGVVSKALAECKEQVGDMVGAKALQPGPEQLRSSFTEPLVAETESRIEASRREVQTMLAEFRNDIELCYKKTLQQCRTKPFDRGEYIKILNGPPLPTLDEDIRNLYREIAMVKIELPKSNLMEFHNYSFSRINYELYEIEEIVDGLYGRTGKELDEAIQSAGDFAERVEWLGYQIRGLRKKYLLELNASETALSEQEQLAHDLSSLDKRHHGLTKKLAVLVENLQETKRIPILTPQRTDDRR